jgi:hypothetical protein
MSISIMEALASGLPVISRELSEYRELFPGIAGFFNKSEEIAPLLADDAMLRNAASHARASIEQYNMYKVAKMHADLYAELLA